MNQQRMEGESYEENSQLNPKGFSKFCQETRLVILSNLISKILKYLRTTKEMLFQVML
jgi:hypothetical protein